MDEQLKQSLAPNRAKGRAPVREQREEAAWAETLEWQTREQDLNHIIRLVIARLDYTFRQDHGVRLDQIASTSELWASASQSAEWFKRADTRYRFVGIYSHLHRGLDGLLRKRARRVVDERRNQALSYKATKK